MLSHGHQETPGQAREIEQANYEERADAQEAYERVTPGSLWSCREDLWLNDRLPPGSIAARFTVTKLALGPFYRIRCSDAVTGRVQDFRPGEWGFLEAWMSELNQERS
jgi:hypothetical protein